MADGRDFGLFWDSVSGDRKYNSDAFTELISNYFTTGVFNGSLKVVHDTDMTIEVLSGWVNIEGRCKKFAQTDDLILEAAHSQYPRNDAVIVYADYVNRNIGIRVQTGSYSGQTAPLYTPVRTSEMYELILAYVYVGAGVTEIDQSNITDKRFDTSVCGIVTGTVEQIDLGTITSQFTTAFTNWFQGIKGQLSTDAAGNLQNQIDELVDNLNASQIDYSNANSGLESTKIQGAIDEVAERIAAVAERIAAVEPTVATHTNQLMANNKQIYLDYHDGKYGYNTDPNRGADTFFPFKSVDNIVIGATWQANSANADSNWSFTYTVDIKLSDNAPDTLTLADLKLLAVMSRGDASLIAYNSSTKTATVQIHTSNYYMQTTYASLTVYALK